MSYSYITKVFPDFQYSNVYDSNLYNNISGLNKSQQDVIQFKPLNESESVSIAYQEINKKGLDTNIETNIETYQDVETLGHGTNFLSQNNLKYYNQPYNELSTLQPVDNVLINKKQLQDLYLPDEIHIKESFSELKDSSHETYTKHILECYQCKELLLKQFNIETERIRNEEILELITFLILGLFILLLLDGLKK